MNGTGPTRTPESPPFRKRSFNTRPDRLACVSLAGEMHTPDATEPSRLVRRLSCLSLVFAHDDAPSQFWRDVPALNGRSPFNQPPRVTLHLEEGILKLAARLRALPAADARAAATVGALASISPVRAHLSVLSDSVHDQASCDQVCVCFSSADHSSGKLEPRSLHPSPGCPSFLSASVPITAAARADACVPGDRGRNAHSHHSAASPRSGSSSWAFRTAASGCGERLLRTGRRAC